MNKHNNTTCGFTLIETLVAISILMIAIAGPLTVANKAYHTALGTRDQVIATNLAQEAMEYINYWKDNRKKDIFEGWETDTNIAQIPPIFSACRKDEPKSDCDVSGMPGFSNISETPDGFTRYYYFTKMDTSPINVKINQVFAHVVVKWKGSGGEERETVLKTILTNHAR